MKWGWGGSFPEIQHTLQNMDATFECFGLLNYEFSSFIYPKKKKKKKDGF